VGDYYPAMLTIAFGNLRLGISNNYHADRQPGRAAGEPVYGIRIRKDKPFVLDFSNPPAVLLASPAKDAVFKRGDEVKVAAVLIDPVLDVMIRDLDDTSHEVKKELRGGPNETRSVQMPLSLDPKVVITDSSGKTLAEGVMPFG